GRARTRPDAVLGDKAYSSRANRTMLRKRRIRTVIPEPADQQANRKRRGSVAGGHPTSTPTCTSSATSSNAPSPCSSSGAHWPPGMTSTPPSTAAPSSSPQSSPGYAVRRHALDELTTTVAPLLRQGCGIGADSAAEILSLFGDNPERLRSEAALAK